MEPSAVNPYLALDTIHELIDTHMLDKDYYAAVDDYNHAVIGGIVKIASKMGIFHYPVLSGISDL